jgi:thiosulfate dehydrogenase
MWKAIKTDGFLILIFLIIAVVVLVQVVNYIKAPSDKMIAGMHEDSIWTAPSLYIDMELEEEERKLIMYGEELISHTAKYLGPSGTVAQLTNGMNCQNCHLDAGTRVWGNNYSAVFSTYPRYRDRSGSVETIYKRITDCMERSLNGKAPDSNSTEMKAIYAYMKWLGKNVKPSVRPKGSGLQKLPYLERAADTVKGKQIYISQCARCHGENGEGIKLPGDAMYTYPPLWGNNSYNDAAGLFRISNFAGYVKNNMPFDQAYHTNTILSNEEAWDVAAFVNSQPRPHLDQSKDWPDISKKPIDYPFGPYSDSFPERQHKYGPFGAIERDKERRAKSSKR